MEGELLGQDHVRSMLLPALFVVLIVSLSIRLLPLMWSPLPYNIDGLSEVRVSEDVLLTGSLEFSPSSSHAEGYVVDMPLLGVVIAFVSAVVGVEPLIMAQACTALLGSVAVLIFVGMFAQHWRTRRGAVAMAMVLALTGSFVFSSGCVWKESLGFVLVGLAVYSYAQRERTQYRILLTLSLVLLVFTHHHSTVVGFVIVTFAVLLDLSSRPKERLFSRSEEADLLTVVLMWLLAASYYAYVDLPYLDYLSPSADLYLFVSVAALLLLLGARIARRDRPLSTLPLGLSVPAIGLVIMVWNYFDPLFAGIPGPASLVAVPVLGYLILVAPAWEGACLAFPKKGKTKNLLLALLLGPLSLILFAFLRSLDVTSHMVVFRTFDFLMPLLAVLIGIGFASMVKGRNRLGIAAGASLVVVCASTLPVAYQSQELFGVQNQTYWFEYDAFEWFAEHGIGSYTSDQRLGETGSRLFDLEYGRGLPYDLREGLGLNGSSFFVVEGQWSTKGAQEFPFGVVVVEKDTIEDVLAEVSVLYVGGPKDNALICFRTK